MTAAVLAAELAPAVQAPPAATTFRGLSVEQVDTYEARIEAATRAALRRVMRQVTARLGETTTAAALVAADASAISPDDLSGIGPLWHAQVQAQLQPVVAEVYRDAGGALHASLVDAVGDLPRVSSVAAETYLAQSATTFDAIGAQLWETARSQLIDGMAAGEDIPTLAKRLRSTVPDLTARQATLVARTQVNDAANAGSYATAQASGLDLVKGWETTADLRTRETHLFAGSRYSGPGMILLAETFMVGGWPCERPHDPSLPPAERYNCRCTIVYAMREPGFEERQQEFRQRVEADLAEQRARREAALAAQQERLEASLEEQRRRLLESFEAIRRGMPLARAVPDTGPAGRAVGQATAVPVRPAFLAAASIEELEAAFLAEWDLAIAGYQGAVRGTASFYRLGDLETAREHAEGLMRGIESFPMARLDVGHSRQLLSYAETPGNLVQLSEGFSTARPVYLESLRRDGLVSPQGWSWRPASTSSPQGISLHEFGHALAHDLAPDLLDRHVLHGDVLDVARDLAAARGVLVSDLVKAEIGEYADTNSIELLAEAFADVMVNGDAASVLSRRIFTVLWDRYDRRLQTPVRPSLAPRRLPPALAAPRPPVAPLEATSPAEAAQLLDTAPARFIELPTVPGGELRDEFRLEWRDGPPAGWGQAKIDSHYRVLFDYSVEEGDVTPWALRAEIISPQTRRGARLIDEIMQTSPLDQPVIVWRGSADVGRLIGGDLGRNLAGASFVDPSFISTSALRSVAESFASQKGYGRFLLRLHVPAGTRAVALGGDAAELLLQRGLTLTVLSDQQGLSGGLRLLDVVVSDKYSILFGRTIGEALIQLDAGTDLARIVALFEGDPALRKALLAARRATDRDKLAASLRRLADREGVAIPTPAQLRTIKAAERKAAAKAKREAALAARAEKARLAEVKAQVKAVHAGDFRTLVQTDTGVYRAADDTLWTVESFASEREARERVLAMALQDLVDPARTGPTPLAVAGQGAAGPGGWQVAYAGTVPRAALTLDDWLGSASLDQLKAVIPARLRALVTKVGLSPADAERLVARRADALVREQLAAARFRSQGAPLLTDLQGLAAQRNPGRFINGQYGSMGLRARVTTFDVNLNWQISWRPVIDIKGDILQGGRKVGRFHRDYSFDNGELVAHHAYLTLDPAVQGSGFAEEFNANLIDWYRRSGIKEVRLSANVDVGGYAWARAGYEFADQYSAQNVLDRLRALVSDIKYRVPGLGLGRLPGLDDAELDAQARIAQALLQRASQYQFGDPRFPRAYEISQLGRHAGQGKDDIWIGKAAMLGSYWSAVLYL